MGGRPLTEFPSGTEPAWRGGPLARRPAARPGTTSSLASVPPSTSWTATWLIVCHGGVVRAALSHVTGADPRRVAGPANASVTVISGGSLAVYGWTVGSVS